MAKVELNRLLGDAIDRTREKFASQPEVIVKDDSFDVEQLPIDAPRWHRITDVVAVVFDLKSSTNLERGRSAASTASIYDAGVGGVVKLLDKLGADFVDIQGDGGFALFWGQNRYERALCAAITIRTFSNDFTSQLDKKWTNAPSTGFKVGVASGPILAKRVGLARHLELQEPVWAGRPVNYAAKAAQQTEPERIVVTGSVWDAIQENEYLVFSCGCQNGMQGAVTPKLLWSTVELEKIPDDERFGYALESAWCEKHGEEFCNRVLDGFTSRDDVLDATKSERNRLAFGTVVLHDAQKARRREREVLAEELREALRVQAGVR